MFSSCVDQRVALSVVVYVWEMCVCEAVCILAMCMWACVCCMHMRVHICMCLYMCVLVDMWGMCAHVYVRICVCMSVCGYIHVCGFAFTWTACVHAYMSLYTPCARVCTCGCVCVCVYVHVWMCVYECAGTHMYKYKQHVSWGCALSVFPCQRHRRRWGVFGAKRPLSLVPYNVHHLHGIPEVTLQSPVPLDTSPEVLEKSTWGPFLCVSESSFAFSVFFCPLHLFSNIFLSHFLQKITFLRKSIYFY